MSFQFENKFGWGTIIAIIAIVFSIISFVRGCKNEKKLSETKYIVLANQYRPQITIDTNPQLNNISFLIDEFRKTETGVEIEGFMYYNATFTLKNIGNCKANIQAIIYTDTVSYSQKLRAEFLTKNSLRIDSNNKSDRILELLPNENKEVSVNKKLNFPIDNKFNIHVIIYYTNDLGNFFDTYCWFEYKINDTFSLGNKMTIYKGFEIEVPLDNIELIDENKSWKIYDNEESNKVLKTFDTYFGDSLNYIQH